LWIWPILNELAFSQLKLRWSHNTPSVSEDRTLSKFDEARKNSAAANPNRLPERTWEPSLQTVDGVVTGLVGNKLSMKNRDGHVVSHTLAHDATCSRDGKSCQASDFEIGERIRVTVAKADRSIAVGIESLDSHIRLDNVG
jgi:hypothetical protein